jgi:aspartyl-tRNA(Asn)/glutamyl-tRNA(Gln) amidotransferase subunit B
VDLNRAGMPLLEMVSAPDMRSSAEVDAFMRALRNVLLYTAVADCKMQEGKLRFEPSISLRAAGQKELGARVEIKNVGSISAVVKGVDFEIVRQTRALDAGEKLTPETRLWDESLQRTVTMRRKETSADYRYFPEPDLVQIEIGEDWKEKVRSELPELPVRRQLRFQEKMGLSEYDARVLTDEREFADYFEECVAAGTAAPKTVANIFINEVQRIRNEQMRVLVEIRSQWSPRRISEVAELIEKGVINLTTARELFGNKYAIREAGPGVIQINFSEKINFSDAVSVEQIVRDKGLAQISDESALVAVVDRALAANEKSVAAYKSGKTAAFNALLGAVMRETKGKANPQVVRQILEKRLSER